MVRMADHPELCGERNPLLEAMAPFVPMAKLPSKLKFEPLSDVPWQEIAPEARETFIHRIDTHYWPVEPQLEAAEDVQLMLRAGLVARNPLSKREQLRINMIALASTADEMALQSLRVRAGGSIHMAITGMGKSTLVDRALAVFAPDQIIRHGRSEVCGWSALTQVAYLIVDAPANATRAGLLGAIAGALDKLLGTDYATDLRKQKNIDNGVIFIDKTLSNHRVGMLVIDENQKSNLEMNQWGREFILFFLGLMNLGVPVLLMGNPAAFNEIRTSSQLIRRFISFGLHEFLPAARKDVKWWSKQFIPGEMRFRLCETVPCVDEVNEMAFPETQGVPGLFAMLWSEASRIALRRGKKSAAMTIADLVAAKDSARYRELQKIAKSIAEGNQSGAYTDIPVAKSPRRSGDGGADGGRVPDAPDAEGLVDVAKRLAADLRRKETKRKNEDAKNKALRSSLSEDDLRRGVDALSVIAGLSEEQGKLDV